jgi:hypothetical protein
MNHDNSEYEVIRHVACFVFLIEKNKIHMFVY